MFQEGETRWSVSLSVVPLTLKRANEFCTNHHRHHGAFPPGLDYFRIGAVDSDGRIVGVAIVARPPNRNSDDGVTCEVVRCATNGHRNACSFLYGACARIAREMGFCTIITYTLDSESGASLRATGWKNTKSGIRSWWQSHQVAGRTVKARDHYTETKRRWEFRVNDLPLFSESPAPADQSPVGCSGGEGSGGDGGD